MTQTIVNGIIVLPDAGFPYPTRVNFKLTGYGNNNAIIVPDNISVLIDENDGSFSQDLWSNLSDSRETYYNVSLTVQTSKTIEHSHHLGSIIVPLSGPVDLDDLLPTFVTPTTSVSEFLAELVAAVAAAEAAAVDSLASEVAAAASEVAADLSATEAALYDGVKVDVFSELAAITPGDLPVGDLVRVINGGLVYERAPDATPVVDGYPLDYSGSGGVKLYVLPELAAPQTVFKYGVTGGGGDDLANLQIALDEAARQASVGKREVVIRGVGDLSISSQIVVPSGVRLINDGDARLLPLTAGMKMVYSRGSEPLTFYALTADAGLSDYKLTVGSTNIGAFFVGDYVWFKDDTVFTTSPNSKGLTQAQFAKVIDKDSAALIIDRPIQHDFTMSANAQVGVAQINDGCKFENIKLGSFGSLRGGVGLDVRYHDNLIVDGFDIENTRLAVDPDNAYAVTNDTGVWAHATSNARFTDLRGFSLGWYLMSLDGPSHNVVVRDIHGSVMRHVLSLNWNGAGEPVGVLVENGSAHRCTFAGFDAHDVGRDITYRKLSSRNGLDAGFQMRTSEWLIDDCDSHFNATNGIMARAENIDAEVGDAALVGQKLLRDGRVSKCRVTNNGTRAVYSQMELDISASTFLDNGDAYSLTDSGGIHLPKGRVRDCRLERNNGAAIRTPPTNVHPDNYGRVDIIGGAMPYDVTEQNVLLSTQATGFVDTPVFLKGLDAQGYPTASIAQRDGGSTTIEDISMREVTFGVDALSGTAVLVAGVATILNDNIKVNSAYTDGRMRPDVSAVRIEGRGSNGVGNLAVLMSDGQIVVTSLNDTGSTETNDISRVMWTIL